MRAMTPPPESQPDNGPPSPRWPGALVWVLAALAMLSLQPVLDLANLALLLVLAAALAALWLPPVLSMAACAVAVLTMQDAKRNGLGDMNDMAQLIVTRIRERAGR